MRKIEQLIYEQQDDIDYTNILQNESIVEFMNENNLTVEDLKGSIIDVIEYLKAPDKYELNWDGMIELILKEKPINPGIKYLENIYFAKTIDYSVIDTSKNSSLAVAIIEHFTANPQKGYFLVGANGIGKTFMTVAINNQYYYENSKKTLFVFWPDFLQRAKRFERDSFQMIEKVKKAPRLVIDDLGQEAITSWSRDDILVPIITYRLEKGLTTYITSNYTISELEKNYTLKTSESKKVKSLFLKAQTLSTVINVVGKNLR